MIIIYIDCTNGSTMFWEYVNLNGSCGVRWIETKRGFNIDVFEHSC